MTDEDILAAHAAHSMESAYRAGLAEGFRRGVQAAADFVHAYDRSSGVDIYGVLPDVEEQIRALRPEGDK